MGALFNAKVCQSGSMLRLSETSSVGMNPFKSRRELGMRNMLGLE